VSSPRPEIAAVHTRSSLEVLQALAPELQARVLARLPAEAREALDAATRLDYLPAGIDLAVALAIHAEGGADLARRVAREVLRRSLTSNVLGGLVRSATALFGLTPPGLFRWAPRGWAHVCRSCGDLRMESSEGRVVQLALTGLPPELDVPPYLESIGGGLEAFLDLCRVEGRVLTEPRPGGARFTVHWSRAHLAERPR
jgi:hypothetical protein